MDIDALMAELLDHGCIVQSRETLTKSIIEKHLGEPDVEQAVVNALDAAQNPQGRYVGNHAMAEKDEVSGAAV